jgi:hypothetical protein
MITCLGDQILYGTAYEEEYNGSLLRMQWFVNWDVPLILMMKLHYLYVHGIYFEH